MNYINLKRLIERQASTRTPVSEKELGVNIWAIEQVAKSIRHCGDYGQCYFNNKDKEILWVGGDADGSDGETDTFEEIEKKFMAVPGIKKVRLEAESTGGVDEHPDWREIKYKTEAHPDPDQEEFDEYD